MKASEILFPALILALVGRGRSAPPARGRPWPPSGSPPTPPGPPPETPPGRGDIKAYPRAAWLDMPAGGQTFRQTNQTPVALPAIGATATVVSVQVPPGKAGVLLWIANQYVGAGWTEGTGDIIWRLTVDGAPVRYFNNILNSIGSGIQPGDLTATPIRLRENQVLSLLCNNVAIPVAGQELLGMLGGYFYPLTQETEDSWL